MADTIDSLAIEITASASDVISKLQSLSSCLGAVKGSSKGAASGMKAVNDSMEDVASSTQEASSNTRSFSDKIKSLTSGVSSVSLKLGNLGSVAKGAASAFNAFSAVPRYFGGQLVSSITSATSALTGFVGKIKSIILYRAIRAAIKEITQGISEGIKNLYHYSETFSGTFYQSMNQIATEAQYLKNSLGAMFQPLIEYITPFVTYITDKLVSIINLANQFFSALTGKSTYTAAKKVAAVWDSGSSKAAATTKKIKDNTKSTAKNVRDAANEFRRFTLAFDELNILGKNVTSSSGGSGGGSTGGLGTPTTGTAASTGTDYGSMFETKNISSAIKAFADEIKKYIQASDWQGLGTAIGDKIEWLIDNIDFAKYGQNIGDAINGWFTTKYWVLKTVNFTNLGDKIAEFLNNAIANINFNTIGRTLVQKKTILWDMIIGLFTGFDWGQAASSFSDFVIGMFDELTKWFEKYDWKDLGSTLYDTIIDVFNETDFAGMAQSFFTFLGTKIRSTALFLDGFFGNLAASIKVWFIKNIWGQSWTEIAVNILTAIGKGFAAIGTWVWNNILDPFMGALLGEEEWEKIKSAVVDRIDTFMKGINDAAEWVVDVAATIITTAKDLWDGLKSAWDDLTDVVFNIGAGISTTAQTLWDGLKTAWDGLTDIVLDVGAAISTAPKELWRTVQDGWNKLTDKAVSFVAKVNDTSATWLKNVRDWWKNILGLNDGSGFTEVKINPLNVVANWLKKYVDWWASILGLNDGSNFKEVKINPANIAPKWLKSIVGWWKDKLGLNDGSEFKEFNVNVLNRAANWLSNVVGWWRGELGYNDGSRFTEFAVKVREEAWNWWNSVSNAWNNWTRNLSLNATAKISTYQVFTQNGHTFAGAYGSFEEGGSIDAYGRIRRFAKGGVIHAYAGGTTRAMGSLFLAGEAGPEVVGHIGGRTEVLNKSQLAATMYAAVNAAMAPAAAGFASAAQYMYEARNNTSDEDMGLLLELVRAGSDAVQRQNELMRQQNEYLRQINDKDWNPEISTASINRSQTRMNRRAGTTIVAVGNT